MKSVNILSTKILSSQQLNLLNNAQFNVEMYNAISIEKLPFEYSGQIENAIVTSQNIAQIIIDTHIQIKSVFCVGEKTSNLLKSQNYNVVKTARKASVLAEFLVKYHKNDSFLFLCGNIRRNELPDVMTENEINFKEKIMYKTTLNSQVFSKSFEGVLFFSPSGIQSYIQENSLKNKTAFCIGNTTANEAKKHTRNVVIASQATVEHTISAAIHYFKS